MEGKVKKEEKSIKKWHIISAIICVAFVTFFLGTMVGQQGESLPNIYLSCPTSLDQNYSLTGMDRNFISAIGYQITGYCEARYGLKSDLKVIVDGNDIYGIPVCRSSN